MMPSRGHLGAIELDLSLFASDEATHRTQYTLRCTNLCRYEMRGGRDLLKRGSAMTIADGGVVDHGRESTARIEVKNGLFVITARSIRLRPVSRGIETVKRPGP